MKSNKKLKKLHKKIDGHLIKIADHQNKVFKLALQLERPKTQKDCELVRSVIKMYRDNENTLSKAIKIYESWVDEFDNEDT